jgi:hypothetical protein
MFSTRLVAASLVTLMAAATVMAGPPRIIQKPVPGGFKVTIIDFVGGDENAAQAMIAPTVRQLCGELKPRWGRFTLKAMVTAPKGKALKPGRFEQDITCFTPTVAEPDVATGPFSATAADESLVRGAALKFMGLRDTGKSRESFAMLAPSMQETTDPVDWAKAVGMKPGIVGKSVERRISKITWYIDPPGISSGVYAAADFGGRSSGLAIHCGYVALKRQTTGEYLVVRLEEGQLSQKDARSLTPERILEMRSALQCRD